MSGAPPNGDPVARAELGWLERLLKAEVKGLREHVDASFRTLTEKIEEQKAHQPVCAARFLRIEDRLDAPGRWIRGRLTGMFDTALRFGVRVALIAAGGAVAIHYL